MSQRIRVDERYGAGATFRWMRRCGLSMRDAYWVAVAKHGWTDWARFARTQCPRWALERT